MEANGVCYNFRVAGDLCDWCNKEEGKCKFRKDHKKISLMKRCPIEHSFRDTIPVRTHKEGALKSTKSTIKKSGKAKSGKKTATNSSKKTRPVGIVEMIVRFPIIPTFQCMEKRNIKIYQIPSPRVTFATMESTQDISHALNAERLEQNEKVTFAIRVLTMALNDKFEMDARRRMILETVFKENSTEKHTRKKK